jgi:acyl carrier protein
MRLLLWIQFFHLLGQIGIIIALLVVIGIPMWIYDSRAKRKKFEAAFAGRESLDEQTFYERYFRSRGIPEDVVSRVRRIFEEVLNADLSQLKAEDDLTRNLSFFFQFDSMADVELVETLEEAFSIKITDAEAERTHTVEDLINLVWLKVRQRAA